jgi:hypothetical protein
MNTWMNNPQYLAQVGHFLGGASLIVITTLFAVTLGAGWTPILIVLGIGVAAASLKEFWYDMKYELPKQTWGDSFMDWGFYMLGGGVGMGVAALAEHLAKHC